MNGTPDIRIEDSVGRVDQEIPTNRIAVAGGYHSMCHTRTVVSVIRSYFTRRAGNYFRAPAKPLIIDLPMTAIFGATEIGLPWPKRYATRHPSFLDLWISWLSGDGLELNTDTQRMLSMSGATYYLDTAKDLEFVNPRAFSVSVTFDGIFQGRFGGGPRNVQFNFWSSSELMIASVFGE